TRVRDIMTSDVVVIQTSATLADARSMYQRQRHGGYPVVDDEGRWVGLLTRDDLLLESADASTPVGDLVQNEGVAVEPDEPAIVALERMLTEGVDHLPVLAAGRLVGICTRGDILGARQRQFDHEAIERGW